MLLLLVMEAESLSSLKERRNRSGNEHRNLASSGVAAITIQTINVRLTTYTVLNIPHLEIYIYPAVGYVITMLAGLWNNEVFMPPQLTSFNRI